MVTEKKVVPILFVLAVNLISLAFVVAGIVRSGERAQVLLYAVILECGLRFLTIRSITGSLGRLVSWVSTPPAPDQRSYPVTYADSGQRVGAGGYAVVMGFFAFLVFILGNVNANHELDLDAGIFLHDLAWGVALALLYWFQSLASKNLLIDPEASREVNFGYNTRDVTILAFATLTAGAVVVVRQMLKLPASGWAVLGPLLAFRFLYDVTSGIQAQRRQSPDLR